MLGADERILEREVEIFEALRRARRGGGAAHPGHGARRSPRSTCSRALAETAAVAELHQAADARRRRARRHRRAASRRRAPRRRRVRAERRHARRGRRTSSIILTGPNMGGKSTYLRQTRAALPDGAGRLVRAGAHAPSCRSSIASSRASARPTTSRAASPRSWSRCRRPRTSCTAPTSRSLVILDEIGRGTATFDGLSLAWAVAEHLASNSRGAAEDDLRDALSRAHRPGRRAARRRQLPRRRPRVEGRHRVPAQGRARAAPIAATASRWRGSPGLPPAVVARAREILNGLERDELSRGGRPSLSGDAGEPAAAARPVPGAGCRGRSRCAAGCARSTSTA